LNKRKYIFLSVIFLTSILTSFAQHYNFQNFTVEDGLAQSQILSICQARDGNLWFGTNNGGVSIYDGNKFTTFNENDSLVNNVVYSITSLKDGALLLGTGAGLTYLKGKQLINFSSKDGLPSTRVFKTSQDNQGTIWIGTEKGLCKLINNKIELFTEDTVLSKADIFSMFLDMNGNMWFGTMSYGLIKYNPISKKTKHFNQSNGLLYNFVWAINEDNKGNIYVGTNVGVNKITPQEKISKFVTKGMDSSIPIRAIIKDRKNNLWFVARNTIYKYDHKTCKFFGEKNGLVGNSIYSAIQDSEGNIWIAMHGIGLIKFSGEAFSNYGTKDNLPGEYINSIFQDSQSNMWLGIKGFGVCKINGEHVQNFKQDFKNLQNSIVVNEIQAICEDNNGNIFLGGAYRGLSIYNGKTFQNFDDSNGLPNSNVYSITKDHEGVIWIGTADGLCFYKNGKIEVVDVSKKNVTQSGTLPIYCITEDKNYNLWLATENGVLKYNRRLITKFNTNNGFTDKRVVSIAVEMNGNIWFGSDEGVYRYNLSTFDKIDYRMGLSSNSIYFVAFDDLNNLWIGSNKGLDKLNCNTYNVNKNIEIRHFDKGDGLMGLECNRNAKFKDKEGKLWFGTINGVTIYDPNYAKKNDKEALTRITGIRLFFENAENELKANSTGIDSTSGLPVNLVLPHNKNHITFDFIGVCLTDPTKVRYQTKLEGIDKDWFPPTSKTDVTYSTLPPGKYVFHLKAMNNDGLWNKNDVTYSFEIIPPWYATWRFRIIVSLLLISSVVGYFYYRTATLRTRQKQLEQLVLERTSEVVLQKDEAEKQKEIADSQRIIAEELRSVSEQQRHIVEEKQKEIVDSITYAKRIQTALLTSEEYISENLPAEHFILFKPKDIVSGDFYWALKVARLPGWDMGTNKKKLPSYESLRNIFYIITGDCTGHGVPGAFMSMLNISFLNEIIVDHGKRLPHDILNEQRKEIIQALNPVGSNEESKDGMDCVLCAYDFDKMLLHFAAANNPLWLVRNNELIEYRGDKMPVGKYMDNMPPFNLQTIELLKGDIIYTSTDGYADQFGVDGKKLMKKKFKQELLAIHKLPMPQQKEHLANFFETWKGKEEQLDDVCVIGIQIT
jgi:ligand-binding sensor domain-containing protein/serine phosphatase RsbU (regulator of sigma subunit)